MLTFERTIARFYEEAQDKTNRVTSSPVRRLLARIGLRLRDARVLVVCSSPALVWLWTAPNGVQYIVSVEQYVRGVRPVKGIVFAPADEFGGLRHVFTAYQHNKDNTCTVALANKHCFYPSCCFEWKTHDDEADELLEQLGYTPDPRPNSCECVSIYDCVKK